MNDLKLWLLRPTQHAIDHPTFYWGYDCYYGHVIRASSEEQARRIAAKDPGDEGDEAWLDSTYSTCIELTFDGPEGRILSDFNAG